MKQVYNVILFALLAGCAPQAEQAMAPVAATPASSNQIISGPAPVPTPASMGAASTYATNDPSVEPVLPNDNPGNGIDLGATRRF